MALTIDVERVTAVLLADGWHYIQPASFRVEEYGFASADPGAPAVALQKGYAFTKVDQITRELQYFAGPISYVLSVRYAVLTEIVDPGAVDDDDDDDDEDEED